MIEEETRIYGAIDIFKFIGSFFVIMIHMAPFNYDFKYAKILNMLIQNYLSRVVVPFFFVTAGYFLFYKMEKDKINFIKIKKYFFHILKLYFIWLLVYLPYSLFSLKDVKHRLLIYIRNVVFAGGFDHLWYLSALCFVVALIYILLYLKIPIKKILFVSLIFYFMGLLTQSWFAVILPLKNYNPKIWQLLIVLKSIIYSARDGLFFGFLFFCIGMIIALSGYQGKSKKNVVCLIFSMIMFLTEIILLKKYGNIRERDMYLCLVPVAVFLFCLLKNINMKKRKVYVYLRYASVIIYCSQRIIQFGVENVIKIDGGNGIFSKVFVMVCILAVIFSTVILYLAEYKKVPWLYVLYRP